MSFEQQSKVKSLIYLVETFNKKQPPAWTLGGRYVYPDKTTGIFDVSNTIKNDKEIINGHINRNIRMIYNLAEMSSPYIKVLGQHNLKVYWTVQGCAS